MNVLLRLVVAALLGAGASACARTQARTQPEAPPLATPPAPPRVIVPIDSEPITSSSPPADEAPARPPGSRGSGRAAPPRSELKSDGPKPEPAKPGESAKAESAAEPPRAAVEEPVPPRTLQTAPAANAGEAEKKIRGQLTRAARDLNRVDYGALSVDAKAQYDTAKRFMRQAEEALKVKNFVFAENLADKAAALAAILLGR